MNELKDQKNPNGTTAETGSFLKQSTEEKIPYHIRNRRRDMWLPSKVTPHPLVKVRVKVDSESYVQMNFTTPRYTQTRNMFVLADSRAQMAVMGPTHAAMMGIKEKECLPAKMTVQVANNRSTKVLGMAIIKITTIGSNRTTQQQAYIMETGNQLYLSHQALRDLDCLPENYPEAEVTGEEGNLSQVGEVEEARSCDCTYQSLPSNMPKKMPYEATEENVDKHME